ncbi:gluconate:H+ symporter [Actinoallomurus bryophytorum]|uniref:GntP family gluconate:H+ symporter n=1 Tax=Actinoallomurus bryophytorum TaxID=1490222 RepID=A0A543CT55_9ACTN|nr:gluconate:H+ symporter [Actinoallomurus bryophytorum]TQM00284.1 GntP family gluconate:H+ symporter [Actinoallomurus bryophytorum]
MTPLASGVLASSSWTGHDTRLIMAAVVGVAVIVVLITQLKVHPFLALALGSGVLGAVAGMSLEKMIASFSNGLGMVVASVGVLIALGSMLGKLLAESGGADQIVDTIISKSSARTLPWAMTLIAVLIGLPMFFEIGLVLLVPVVLLVAKRSGRPLMLLGIPALAGLSVLHGLVPPHPGPLVAVSTVKADLGVTLALGLLVAIPTVIIAGPLFGRVAARWVHAEPPAGLMDEVPEEEGDEESTPRRRPGFALTVGTVLLPVVLMLAKAVADVWLDEDGTLRTALDAIGTPLFALLVAVVVAMFTLGLPAGFDRARISTIVAESLPPIASVLLIVGAGGGFKQTLIDAGVGKAITQAANGANISALVLGWLVAVGIRLATGSATVATISAAGIVAPLATGMSSTHTALLVLAIGSGSLFFSHVNDAGFWLVKEFFGMSVGQTIKTWSVMETIISVVSIIFILLLNLVL